MLATNRWLRWTVRSGLFVLGAAFLGVVGAAVFLASDTGRDTVARLAADALSDDTMTVRIDGPGGSLLSAFRIGRITVTDRSGNAIAVEDVQVDWRPAALLGGTLDIRALTVRRVAADAFVVPSTGEPSTTVMPPLSIRIGELTVDEIALGPAILGEPQRLSLSGSAALDSRLSHASIEARLARRDGAPGHADIDLDYAADPARFDARIDIREPAGGPVARLAGLPPGAPLLVSLDGRGPADGWRGRLVATAGGGTRVAADMSLAVQERGVALTVDGAAEIAALLPETVRAFAHPRIDLHVAVEYGKDGTIALKALRAKSDALAAEGTGRYAIGRDAVDATLSVVLRDTRPVSALAPTVALDGARFAATLGGTVARPAIEAKLDADGLSVDGARATSAAAQASLAPGAQDGFALSGTLGLAGLDAAAFVPEGILADGLDLELDGTVRRDGTVPRLTARATSGAAAIEIDAASTDEGVFEGRYTLRHERIAAVATRAGLPLREGSLHTEGAFRADFTRGDVSLGVSGAASDLVAAAPWATTTLGRTVALSGTLAWDGDGTLRATDIDVASDTARVRGSATIHPADGRLTADYAVDVADLQPLSPVAGTPLGGSLSLTGSAEGTVAAPALAGQLALRRLALGDVAIGSPTVEISARPAAAGLDMNLKFGGDIGGIALGGRSILSLTGDTARLAGLDVTLGRNAVAGNITTAFDGPRLTGDVTATLADLAGLPRIADLPVLSAGEATMTARLRHDRGQQVTLDVSVAGVKAGEAESGDLTVGRATAKLDVRDALGQAALDGALRLSGLRVDGAALPDLDLTVSGTPSALDWTVAANGEKPVRLALSAAGGLALGGERVTATVKKLDGTVATHPVRLQSPATVAWSPGALTAGPVDLSAAGGRLRLSLKQDAGSITVDGTLDDLPVALGAPFDARLDLAGTIDGTLRIAGEPRRPAVDVALTATGVRPRDIAEEKFPGLTVAAELKQDRDSLRGRLDVRGTDGMTATASLRTAPALSLAPFSVAPAPDQTLSGQVDAAGNLTILDRLVGLGGDRLGGRIAAKAGLSGTVGRPELRGEATLADGSYEGVATGIVVRDATARVVFTGDEARLESLSATDGGEGRLSGSGAVALAEGSPRTGDLAITLVRFAALNHHDADILASGTLSIEGSVDAPALAGTLTVDRSEIRIPDRLPRDVVVLDVVEINRPETGPASEERTTEPSASRALAARLDVAIDFPARSFVRGRGLDSEWKGRLNVAGTTAKPVITGELSVVRGTFAFAGKTFRVTSGGVTFTGGDPPEPEIDAVAEAKLEEIVAQVRITGKASSPSITVTSEPALPEEDVLARILYGRDTGELTALQAAQLAQTAATLSGATGGGGIVDRVRQALGVDVLDVGGSEDGGPSLKAGKYVTEDVFLSVTQGTKPGSQKVGVEVEVLPNLSLESDVTGQSSGNVGVNWKFDY